MFKSLVSFIFVTAFSLCCYAQSDTTSIITLDSIAANNSELLKELINQRLINNESNRYKIYPTENIYILIKLDTQTGRIDLIQWSLKSEKEFSATLNSVDLSLYEGLNSFELYPTKNMYQFILLDKATGRNWHVQWGTKSSEMWIRRIY